jgi:hypothetical protein
MQGVVSMEIKTNEFVITKKEFFILWEELFKDEPLFFTEDLTVIF